MATVNEIRLGQESLTRLLVKGLVALAVLWIVLFILPGCSDEYERLQAEADFNAKMTRAATPHKGELVTIREFADGRYVVRRYHDGLKSTDIIARED